MKDKKVKPLSPDEVVNAKQYQIPDEVISTFNTLIAKNFLGKSATFKQCEVVEEIIKNIQEGDWEEFKGKEGTLKSLIFNRHWLDVEDIFRSAGWDVKYDKPGYNESYDAFFTFKKK